SSRALCCSYLFCVAPPTEIYSLSLHDALPICYVSLVKCNLETGRTHQIRVHFQYKGHPLFNDAAYGGNRILRGIQGGSYKTFVENCFKILPRQALHAQSLGLEHPRTGKWMQFEIPLPDDMREVIARWENYVQYN